MWKTVYWKALATNIFANIWITGIVLAYMLDYDARPASPMSRKTSFTTRAAILGIC